MVVNVPSVGAGSVPPSSSTPCDGLVDGWDAIGQQIGHAPDVIRDRRCQRGGLTERGMHGTKVIDTANQIDRCLQTGHRPCAVSVGRMPRGAGETSHSAVRSARYSAWYTLDSAPTPTPAVVRERGSPDTMDAMRHLAF